MRYNDAVKRVKAYMKIEKEVYEETGEHTLYTVNVTDRLPRMFDLAKRCIDAGANAHDGQLSGCRSRSHARPGR